MELSGKNITILGAGIGGLAVACTLLQRGAKVQLLEQASALREVGAGIQISPNGFAVLRALGLAETVQTAAMQAQAVALHDYRKGQVLKLDLGQLAKHDYYFLHRADLVDVLKKAALKAGLELRLGCRVAAVDPGGRITLANGQVEARPDLIIGADGLHSVARPALNGAELPRFTGQVAWRALVPNRAGRTAEAWVHMAPHRHLVSYPVRDGALLNLVAIEERAEWCRESWSQPGDPDRLRAAFDDFGAPARAMLADVDTAGQWGLFLHQVAPVWGQDRLALLGDAAHPMLPFMAQGAAMALEDGWVLADSLARAPGRPEALQLYQARRAPRVRRVVRASARNAWKYHLAATPLRWGAHQALRLAGSLAPGRMLGQFAWLYDWDVTAPRVAQPR